MKHVIDALTAEIGISTTTLEDAEVRVLTDIRELLTDKEKLNTEQIEFLKEYFHDAIDKLADFTKTAYTYRSIEMYAQRLVVLAQAAEELGNLHPRDTDAILASLVDNHEPVGTAHIEDYMVRLLRIGFMPEFIIKNAQKIYGESVDSDKQLANDQIYDLFYIIQKEEWDRTKEKDTCPECGCELEDGQGLLHLTKGYICRPCNDNDYYAQGGHKQ